MKSTNYLILILSLILFSCTDPDDADELISSTYVTEFTTSVPLKIGTLLKVK